MSVGKMQFLTGVSLPLPLHPVLLVPHSKSVELRSAREVLRSYAIVLLSVDGSLLDKDSLVHPNDSIVQSSH